MAATDAQWEELKRKGRELFILIEDMNKLRRPGPMIPGRTYGCGFTGTDALKRGISEPSNSFSGHDFECGINYIRDELRDKPDNVMYIWREMPYTFVQAQGKVEEIYFEMEKAINSDLNFQTKVARSLKKKSRLGFLLWLLVNLEFIQFLFEIKDYYTTLTKLVNWTINSALMCVRALIKTTLVWAIPLLFLNHMQHYTHWCFETVWIPLTCATVLTYIVFMFRSPKEWIVAKQINKWVCDKLMQKWFVNIVAKAKAREQKDNLLNQ